MTDWHSHILPNVDDGSQSVEESIQLLKMLKQQGVDTVIATPHFHANSISVDEFKENCKTALDRLKAAIPSDFPKIVLGAEVRYYSGISKLKNLNELCVEGTDILLVEMPFEKWTKYTVNEIIELASMSNVTLVLAHIERYFSFVSSDTLTTLLRNGVHFQANASFFDSFTSRSKAIKMLKSGIISFIGSDLHNIKHRPPVLDRAFKVICKKLGQDYLANLNEYEHYLLT